MKPFGQEFSSVIAHYQRQDLEEAILEALVAAGKDPEYLKPEDLAPIDEFHTRGRMATLEMACQISLKEDSQVLDVGSGLGGPSRCLASEFGCCVTGLDLNAEYCRVAGMLARRLGLDSRVSYRQGNALAMPFEDAAFDVLWTQHAAMNIADKHTLYKEMWRILKPGGVLAIYDVLEGTGAPLHYPVPWAREASTCFLISPLQMQNVLHGAGFEVLSWRDTTETDLSWFRQMREKKRTDGSSPLGIHLLLGSDFQQMAQNQIRNLEENRVALIEAVVRRPA